MEANFQKDLVIAVLGGAVTLASLSLAFFGFVYAAFAQIMGQVRDLEEPPIIADYLRGVATCSFFLTLFSSVDVGLCVWWLLAPNEGPFFLIWFLFLFILFLMCALILYVIYDLMRTA